MLPDPRDKVLIAVIAGIVGWLTSHLAERQKRKSNRIKTLQTEYANWLTDQKLLQSALTEFLPIANNAVGSDYDKQIGEIGNLIGRIESLLKSSNLIILLEKDDQRSSRIKHCTETRIKTQNAMRGFLGVLKTHGRQLVQVSDLEKSNLEKVKNVDEMTEMIDQLAKSAESAKPETKQKELLKKLAQVKSDINEFKTDVHSTGEANSVQKTKVIDAGERHSQLTIEINREFPNMMRFLEKTAEELAAKISSRLQSCPGPVLRQNRKGA